MKRRINKEAAAYVAAGIATTLINIAAYHVFCNILKIPNLVSNAAAWMFAVAFAFLANDRFVFTGNQKKHRLFNRLARFLGARFFSLILDEACMFLLVDVLVLPNLFSKILINGLIIIVNYILSKCFIFK